MTARRHRKPPKGHHPALIGTPVGIFNPEAVGKAPGYPASAEAFEARREHLRRYREEARAAGRLTRRGIPNGWAGRRAEVEQCRAVAAREGAVIAAALQGSRGGPRTPLECLAAYPVSSPEWEAAAAEVAIAGCIAVILDPTQAARTRMMSVRMVMPYLRPLPRRGAAEALDDGLGWLEGLAEAARRKPQ